MEELPEAGVPKRVYVQDLVQALCHHLCLRKQNPGRQGGQILRWGRLGPKARHHLFRGC